MARGDGIALLRQRVRGKMEGRVGFDPASLIAAIVALISQFCSPRSMRRRLFNRTRLASRIQDETGCSWREALDMADDTFALAEAAKDEELQALIDDCA